MADVAIYVQNAYARKTYSVECYDVRAWPGMEMIRDNLQRNGIEVDYCSASTVTDYKIVLVSITSATDWYSYIAERVTWRTGKYKVIIGGAGVLNIRPVLPFGDIFVFGRGENLIVDLVKDTILGNAMDHPSVAYSETFSPDKSYQIRQVEECYPHEITLSNGKRWKEMAIGCQRRCLFCGYTWQRKHVGGSQVDSGAGAVLWNSKSEFTVFELDLDNYLSWPGPGGCPKMIGIDGRK